MCRIRDDVLCEVYPEVEIDDDLCICLDPSVVASTPVVGRMVVRADGAGSGFFVGSAYVEVVCGRSSGVGKEEAVEGFTWIPQHQIKGG